MKDIDTPVYYVYAFNILFCFRKSHFKIVPYLKETQQILEYVTFKVFCQALVKITILLHHPWWTHQFALFWKSVAKQMQIDKLNVQQLPTNHPINFFDTSF